MAKIKNHPKTKTSPAEVEDVKNICRIMLQKEIHPHKRKKVAKPKKDKIDQTIEDSFPASDPPAWNG